MAVSGNNNKVLYNGDASTVAFAYDYRIFAATDLVVKVDGSTWTITTDYAVSGVNDAGGGTVTFTTAPVAGTNNVVIIADIPEEQGATFAEGDAFPANTVNDSLDKLTRLTQQHSEILSRCLKVPNDFTSVTFDPEVPDPGLPTTQSGLVSIKSGGLQVAIVKEASVDAVTVLTAEGELIAGDASGNATTISIGTDDQFLIVDTTVTGKLKWASIGSIAKNHIINGNFDIWQEATSFAVAASDVYLADMWEYTVGGRDQYAATISRSTDVPTIAQAGEVLNYSLLVTTTTKETALAVDEQFSLTTKILGYNVNRFVGQTITISFHVKCSIAGTYVLFLSSGGTDRNFVKTFTIDSANTWEAKSITLTMDDQTNGTWNNTNGIGLIVGIALSMGSNFDGTDNTWASSNARSVVTATNTFITTAASTIRLAGVKFVEGNATKIAQRRTISEELALAKTYYKKSYSDGVDPGASTQVGAVLFKASGTAHTQPVYLATDMRAKPSVTVYSTTGASGKWRKITATAADETATAGNIGTSSFSSANAATTDQQDYGFHFVADARL